MGPIFPPSHSAGTDPAYIPGLMAPRPDEAERQTAEEEAGGPLDGAASEDEAAFEGADPERGVSAEEADEEETHPAGAAEGADEEGAEGPVFEASDRRGAIIADRAGLKFRLDDEKAEFLWKEIGAVEIDTPRFGRRFGVTVHTTDRRSYEADVEAPARARLKEWTAALDAVLDTYFEE